MLKPVFKKEDFQTFYEDRKLVIGDSKAGFDFYNYFYPDVVSAHGKSKMITFLGAQRLEFVADGAAFGCEIEKVMFEITLHGLDTKLFLPESFEYLLLSSGLFKQYSMNMDDISNKIFGLQFSWEQYFTYSLIHLTHGLANDYSKTVLNECYYKPCCIKGKGVCNIMQTTKKKDAILGKYLNNSGFVQNSTKMNVF